MSAKKTVSVIGSGNFGITLANLLAENGPALLYTRRKETVDKIIDSREHKGYNIHTNVIPTTNPEQVANESDLLIPTVPSSNFREMVKEFSPFLRPDHMLIHATKGLDIKQPHEGDLAPLSRQNIRTMSQVIREESVVIRVGCLSGPNLAKEIASGNPAATVIASKFDEVINAGIIALKSHRFRVYGSHDILGAEMAGVLKNIIAIASGIITGMGYGENARALLITQGLSEMIRIGTSLGSDVKAFLGLAGLGDLIATASSKHSRNYTVGFRLAKGESLKEILDTTDEVAEGINTVRIVDALSRQYDIRTPISAILFRILFRNLGAREGLGILMDHPFNVDVDYI